MITPIPFTTQFLSFASCEEERRGFCLDCCLHDAFKFPAPAVLTQLPVLTWQQRTDHHWLQSVRQGGHVTAGGGSNIEPWRLPSSRWCLITARYAATTTMPTKRWIRHKACLLSLLMLIFFSFFLNLYNLLCSSSSLCRPSGSLTLHLLWCASAQPEKGGKNESDWLN